MNSFDAVEIIMIFLLVTFVTSIPGLWPLIFWIRRSSGDPGRILAQRPTLPWWAKGFIGNFFTFLTLSFWVGVIVGVLLLIGEAMFSFEMSDSFARSIRYGIIGGCAAMTAQLYQKAASIAFPPYLNWAEKKALKKLKQAGGDLGSAVTQYQLKLGKVFENPTPLEADGVNFRDPQSGVLLGKVSWNQVVCVPHILTNQFIVLYIEGPVLEGLGQVAQGHKPNYYRVYFSQGKIGSGGIKMQALAKHLWVESHKSSSGETINPEARRIVNRFD